jgi:hypothetical protein
MKIRKLNETLFKSEKQKILSVILEWKESYRIDVEGMVKKLGLRNATWFAKEPSELLGNWWESMNDMINFLEKNQEKYPHGFTFFIAENDEDNTIQGIAMGYGPQKYGGHCNSIFGIKAGTYFKIQEIMVSEPHIFARGFHTLYNYNASHQRIGKALLQAVVHHVNNLDKPYPISSQPHPGNDHAREFFSKNFFKSDSGSMGCSYVLEVSDFASFAQNSHDEFHTSHSPDF